MLLININCKTKTCDFYQLDMQIKKGKVVSLRYVMKDDDGEIIDNTMQGSPIEYLHGGGNILPSLEALLEGLETGTEKAFTVHDAQLNKPIHFEIHIENIRTATDEEIEKRRVLKDCGPGCCC